MGLDLIQKMLEEIKNLPPISQGLVIVIMLAVIFGSISKIFETLSKFYDGLSSFLKSSHSRIKGNAAYRDFLRRREQFLHVLSSDLSGISKAEAWNDQYFTDLEAEVEIEGTYYDNLIKKIIGYQSSGRRRESSLMRAIEKSSERNLLLIGDPGAGKSVALRHLALQLIKKTLRSKDVNSPIPLYINLREFVAPDINNISVDTVKDFVIDNIRRGDADTAEYIKENWSDFRDKGVWFFLFDSFDEIPAVLHSATGDESIAAYGKSIQMFMSGIGSCRGVIASREYKRPATLDWPKLKILPLDVARQEELVNRTFLSKEEKEIALRAMTLSLSATYKNPLFLALLCRHVKVNKVGPINEHNLLMQHVQTLSKRDSSYVEKKWGLGSEDIINGAAEIAFVFATSPNLGLYPTIEDISSELKSLQMRLPDKDAYKLIEALTYVKIGRTDVSGQDVTVRRFAFSHRRYQECLYAQYLSNNIEKANLHELLTDTRWREYVVAILQIGGDKAINLLVSSSSKIIQEVSLNAHMRSVEYHKVKFSTFEWNDHTLEHILSLFLEVIRYRPDGPWSEIENAIEKFFDRQWKLGDYFDRYKVIQYSALGSKQKLTERIEFSICSGISVLEELAFDACRFSLAPSDLISNWVRKRVAIRMLESNSREEFLMWEASAAQLPISYRAALPMLRARNLRFPEILRRLFDAYFGSADKFATGLSNFIIPATPRADQNRNSKPSINVILSIQFLIIYLGVSVFCLYKLSKADVFFLAMAIFMVPIPYLLLRSMRLICIDHPERVNMREVLYRLKKASTSRSNAISLVASSIVISIFSTPAIITYLLTSKLNVFTENRFIYSVVSSVLFLFIISIFLAFYLRWNDKKIEKKLRQILNVGDQKSSRILRSLKSGDELLAMTKIICNEAHDRQRLRDAITYLSSLSSRLRSYNRSKIPKWVDHETSVGIRRSISLLLMRIGSQPPEGL